MPGGGSIVLAVHVKSVSMKKKIQSMRWIIQSRQEGIELQDTSEAQRNPVSHHMWDYENLEFHNPGLKWQRTFRLESDEWDLVQSTSLETIDSHMHLRDYGNPEIPKHGRLEPSRAVSWGTDRTTGPEGTVRYTKMMEEEYGRLY